MSAKDDTGESAALPEPLGRKAAENGLKNSQLHQEYMTRMTHQRDLKVVITAASETGVGKTTLAFALAAAWDIHGYTIEKATLRAKEFETMYDKHPPGSVLILDEAEQALDSRDSMSNENKNVGQKFAECRFGQIVSILTLPSITWLDKRIREDVADYWIECLATDEGRPKGEARVYNLDKDDHRQKTYTKKTEIISWPILDHIGDFQALEDKKRQHTTGETASNYVSRDEFEDRVQSEKEQAVRETRNDFIHVLNNMMKQSEVADVTQSVGERNEFVDGVKQNSVSNIVNNKQ